MVFSDFEYFDCARSADVLGGMLGEYRDIRLIFKHAPSSTNPNSLRAHEAALAAGAQGQFWQMHDVLFENQATNLREDPLDTRAPGKASLRAVQIARIQASL